MILAGRITVNRMPAEVGQKVGPGDEVRINGELVKVRFAEPRARVLIYHKPSGEIVTRDDPEGRLTVFEKLPSIGNGKWISVGRLDFNTEGLLLFTNSGELANRLMHPRYEVDREYAVRVMGRLTDEQLKQLVEGVALDDGVARCQSVDDGGGDEDASNHWYKVVLREGRNREVRRLFEALGVMVSRLIRTRYGVVAMPSTLKRGEWQELDPQSVATLVDSAGLKTRGADSNRPRDQQRGDRNPKNNRRPGARHPHGSASQGRPPGGGHGQPRPHRHAKQGPRFESKGSTHRPHGAPSANGHDRPMNPHKPPRPRGNFDEVQPHSNANASPFATTRSNDYGKQQRRFGTPHDTPRHRSGPRAKAAFGGPKGPGQQRHARPPGKIHEVNGNVAPVADRSVPNDDES